MSGSIKPDIVRTLITLSNRISILEREIKSTVRCLDILRTGIGSIGRLLDHEFDEEFCKANEMPQEERHQEAREYIRNL